MGLRSWAAGLGRGAVQWGQRELGLGISFGSWALEEEGVGRRAAPYGARTPGKHPHYCTQVPVGG